MTKAYLSCGISGISQISKTDHRFYVLDRLNMSLSMIPEDVLLYELFGHLSFPEIYPLRAAYPEHYRRSLRENTQNIRGAGQILLAAIQGRDLKLFEWLSENLWRFKIKEIKEPHVRCLAEYEHFNRVDVETWERYFTHPGGFTNGFRPETRRERFIYFMDTFSHYLDGNIAPISSRLKEFSLYKQKVSGEVLTEIINGFFNRNEYDALGTTLQGYAWMNSNVFKDVIRSVVTEYPIYLCRNGTSMRTLTTSEVVDNIPDEFTWIYGMSLSATKLPRNEDKRRTSLILEAVKRIYQQRGFLTPKLLREATGPMGKLPTPEQLFTRVERMIQT